VTLSSGFGRLTFPQTVNCQQSRETFAHRGGGQGLSEDSNLGIRNYLRAGKS